MPLALKTLSNAPLLRRGNETHMDEEGRRRTAVQRPFHIQLSDIQCVGDQYGAARTVMSGKLISGKPLGFAGVESGSRIWNTLLIGPGRGLFCPWHRSFPFRDANL